jgi:hypothetical protein
VDAAPSARRANATADRGPTVLRILVSRRVFLHRQCEAGNGDGQKIEDVGDVHRRAGEGGGLQRERGANRVRIQAVERTLAFATAAAASTWRSFGSLVIADLCCSQKSVAQGQWIENAGVDYQG